MSPAPIIAHTCQTQALLVLSADLTSSRSLTQTQMFHGWETTKTLLEKTISIKCRHKEWEEQEVEVKAREWNIFDWQGRVNKGNKSFILPLQRLCSGCHYKALIDNNISTQEK